MALTSKNSSAVKLDGAQLKNNGTIVNASSSRPEETPDLNFILDQYENSERISDPTLDYIRRYLLEEDVDECISGYHEVAVLEEFEKPFYEVLGERYPPSPDKQLCARTLRSDQSSITSLLEDQATEKIITENSIIDEHLLSSEFKRGVEDGMKFLPTMHKLTVDLQMSSLSSNSQQKTDSPLVEVRLEEEGEGFRSMNKLRGKKNSSNNAEFDPFEGKNHKKPMIDSEETIRSDMFDEVLLDHGESYQNKEVSSLQEIIQGKATSFISTEIQEHIDLNTLLIHCSEAVSINNRPVAEELLMQIRKQASPTGSGTQRFASIIADGLEARLEGSGSELYRQLMTKRVTTTDILKAYHLFITLSPFYKVSYCFAQTNILIAIQNASKVHIVAFGIRLGFQWPSLIQSLASRRGGAPELRITGIDFPQRGFYPSRRVDEVGKRLEDYARSFNISFEYRGIASQWESVCMEDLNIEKDEVLIVNSMFKFRRVRDDMSTVDSPRNRVLCLIQQMKPQLFIQGIYNATFSSFFKTRFRQVLSCHSMFFDIYDTLMIGDSMERQFLERCDLYAIIVNLLACEGSDWLERPETYKKWHLRNVQAGFEQVPLAPVVVNECRKKLRNGYDEVLY